MKHMISSNIICPIYRHEDSQVIYCTGYKDGTVVHLAFANKTDCKMYKAMACRTEFKECPIYKMVTKERGWEV